MSGRFCAATGYPRSSRRRELGFGGALHVAFGLEEGDRLLCIGERRASDM